VPAHAGSVQSRSKKQKIGSVARLCCKWLGLAKRKASGSTLSCSNINGQLGLVRKQHGHTMLMLTIESEGEKTLFLRTTINPDKLRHV
jgi:hypothetical protein